jgi:hypothetical protein
MEKASTFVDLDVHKQSIDVTLAEAGVAGEVRHFGTLGGDLRARWHRRSSASSRSSRKTFQSRSDVTGGITLQVA